MENDTQEPLRWCGVDYGSKLAGTTVMCTYAPQTHQVHFAAVRKGRDADEFLLAEVRNLRPSVLFIDAPLSLPGVYTGLPGCTDYFYRIADRQLRAMSPMFLGGLTARAVQLKQQLSQLGISVFETYPAAQAKRLDLPALGYKKSLVHLPTVRNAILQAYPSLAFDPTTVASWHHLDALLALIGAIRFMENSQLTYGTPAEGIIVV